MLRKRFSNLSTDIESLWFIFIQVSKSNILFNVLLFLQVDNLCQFLPQDKVQDFSKMNAQALLENTERSIGDPKLLEYHLELKDQRAKFKQLEVEVTNTKRLLESKIQKRDGLQQIVATIKEKKLIKKKIVTLKQKKAWMLYDQMRRKLVEVKKNLFFNELLSDIFLHFSSYFFIINIFEYVCIVKKNQRYGGKTNAINR